MPKRTIYIPKKHEEALKGFEKYLMSRSKTLSDSVLDLIKAAPPEDHPKVWTIDNITEALGLLPWDEQYLLAVQGALDKRSIIGTPSAIRWIKTGRGSGRTTRIICEALVHLLNTGEPIALLFKDSDQYTIWMHEKAKRFLVALERQDLIPGLRKEIRDGAMFPMAAVFDHEQSDPLNPQDALDNDKGSVRWLT